MQIFFHRNFVKKFRKLPEKVQDQFYDRVDLFMNDKMNILLNNHSVGRSFPDCRSINVTGDYRAIFQEQNDVFVFITIGTHSDLY